MRDEHGLAASVSSVKRYIESNLPEAGLRAKVTVLRDDPPPGQEAQIDYGYLGTWIDPIGGRRRRVWAFVMVLAYSRLMFVRPVLTMDQRAWTECHVEAFVFFGGVARSLVPDNLRTGVARPDLYDPKINRSYAELACHYGALVDPARAGKPKDKPRVERPMPYVRDSFWRGRDFSSLAAMQAEALRWCREVAGRRSCRPLDGASPASVFDAAETEALIPLPRNAFVLADWSTGKVGPDIHVKVGRTLYSVPWRYIGRRVDARSTPDMVQLFDAGELIATHVRKPFGKQTDMAHYPPEKIAFAMRGPTWCRNRAAQIGPSVISVITELLADNALFRLRAAQGVLGLAERHGADRLERAAAKAITAGDPTYRTIKGILAAGAEASPPKPSTGDGGAAAFLHGPSRLFGTVVALPTPNAIIPTPAGVDTATTDDGQSPGQGHRVIVDSGLQQALRTLKLSGMLQTLEARLVQARAGELGHIEFLQVLCHDEIARRESQAITRRLRRARFDQQVTLEEFDYQASPKLPAVQIRDWLRCAGGPRANRSCSTDRSVSEKRMSYKDSAT